MLSVKEVAERLKVSQRTVRNLIEKGEIKAHRIGNQFRITEESYQSFVNQSILNEKGE